MLALPRELLAQAGEWPLPSPAVAHGYVRANGEEPSRQDRAKAAKLADRWRRKYPEIRTALDYRNPWELLVATVISAQTTDENVNRAAPSLFARYPTPEDLAGADPEDVEQLIFSTGFYRQKTRSIIALASDLVDRFAGEVPTSMAELVTLKGVGRKTASVVLAEAFGQPAIAVDTHVNRVANRLGLTDESDPVKIEHDLKALFTKGQWNKLSMRMIQFGRDVCDARKPRCWECNLSDLCPYPDKTEAP